MKKIISLCALLAISNIATANTIADFWKQYPELAKNPSIKAVINYRAMVVAQQDALSQGVDFQHAGEEGQKLLKTNGYDYAIVAAKNVANDCTDPIMLQMDQTISAINKKDCQILIDVVNKFD